MNRELLLRVADMIEQNPDQFDMGSWGYTCGTKACIAGWAVICTYGRENVYFSSPYVKVKDVDCGAGTGISVPVENLARELLGLSEYRANKLFFAAGWPEEYRDGHCSRPVMHQMAVKYLRDLAAQAEREIRYRTPEREAELVGA